MYKIKKLIFSLVISFVFIVSCMGMVDDDELQFQFDEDAVFVKSESASYGVLPAIASPVLNASSRSLPELGSVLHIFHHTFVIENSMLAHEALPALIEFLRENFENITEIDCSATCITDEQLTAIFEVCSQVTSLNLSFCRNIKNFNITGISDLQQVALNGTSISDQQLTVLCQNNPKIRELRLNFCKQLRFFDINGLENLDLLELGYGADCSINCISAIRQKFPKINIK